MTNEPTTASTARPSLQSRQVYAMAAFCLVAGLAIGYLVRGSQPPVLATHPIANARPASHSGAAISSQQMRSLEGLKQMADKQAAPLLEKLKSDPKNSALLMQLGAIYHTTHHFKEAAACYEKAVQIDPKNVAIRTKLASSLYRNGDVDEAIAQLNRGLSDDPNDANSLFNLGMI